MIATRPIDAASTSAECAVVGAAVDVELERGETERDEGGRCDDERGGVEPIADRVVTTFAPPSRLSESTTRCSELPARSIHVGCVPHGRVPVDLRDGVALDEQVCGVRRDRARSLSADDGAQHLYRKFGPARGIE